MKRILDVKSPYVLRPRVLWLYKVHLYTGKGYLTIKHTNKSPFLDKSVPVIYFIYLFARCFSAYSKIFHLYDGDLDYPLFAVRPSHARTREAATINCPVSNENMSFSVLIVFYFSSCELNPYLVSMRPQPNSLLVQTNQSLVSPWLGAKRRCYNSLF